MLISVRGHCFKLKEFEKFGDEIQFPIHFVLAQRGMRLTTDAIGAFQYKVADIKFLEVIGTGSYGEVSKSSINGQIVAVKRLFARQLKAEHIDSFCSEASLMMYGVKFAVYAVLCCVQNRDEGQSVLLFHPRNCRTFIREAGQEAGL